MSTVVATGVDIDGNSQVADIFIFAWKASEVSSGKYLVVLDEEVVDEEVVDEEVVDEMVVDEMAVDEMAAEDNVGVATAVVSSPLCSSTRYLYNACWRQGPMWLACALRALFPLAFFEEDVVRVWLELEFEGEDPTPTAMVVEKNCVSTRSSRLDLPTSSFDSSLLLLLLLLLSWPLLSLSLPVSVEYILGGSSGPLPFLFWW
jgi:hypothetical protein